MKRFVAIVMVFALAFAISASAIAETKYFQFAKLSSSGTVYQTETAIKAGGSKYSADFYVTCLKSAVINGTTYTSNLTGGDMVEFRVFDSNRNMITREDSYAVCTYYGQTAKGDYKGNPPAGEAYYLAGRMHKNSASTNKNVVGRWTP